MARAYGCVIDSEYQPELNDNTPDFPWPPRENHPALDALAATWKESVFSPAQFFRRMPREFDFGWAIGYYIIIGVVAGGVSLFWRMLLGPSFYERMLPAESAPGNPVVDFLLSPVILLIGLFLIAGVVHLFLKMLGGARHDFTTTVRTFCFASSPQLFVVVPFVGGLIGGIWSIVITVIGLREAHETTTGKAAAALLIPVLLLLVLGTVLLLAMVAAGLVVDPR